MAARKKKPAVAADPAQIDLEEAIAAKPPVDYGAVKPADLIAEFGLLESARRGAEQEILGIPQADQHPDGGNPPTSARQGLA